MLPERPKRISETGGKAIVPVIWLLAVFEHEVRAAILVIEPCIPGGTIYLSAALSAFPF